MGLTWLSLLPPLLVIGVVCFTKHLNFALACGIVSAALIATQGQMISAFMMCAQKCITHLTDLDNLYLYCFLIMISSLITLLTVAGSAAGCARIIGNRIRTKRGAELSTVMLAFLLSIDDYLSILTVGFVMRPIGDRLAVARTKLAYIMHSLASPLVIIMPISTWAAAILVQLDNAGITLTAPSKIVADPLYVYITTIPFTFYSILMIFSLFFVVITRMSYGLIGRDERVAIAMDSGIQDAAMASQVDRHTLSELLLPIMMLVGGIFFGTLYFGNYYLFGGSNSLFEAFKENDKTFLIMCFSGVSAFASAVIFLLSKKMVRISQVPMILYEGMVLMKSSIIMVAFASILGSFLRLDLHTGSYLAQVLLGSTPISLIPALLFIVSLVITLTTGSAWGTFSLLIPIMTQMLISFLQLDAPVELGQISIFFPALGAVLSGAACGNHISPFAETTVMTATSAGIGTLEHARTQIEYVIPVIMGTFVSYIVVGVLNDNGLLSSFLISAGVGIMVTVLFLMMFNYAKKQV
jgi:Na+/H+ antiporter NhaC